MQNMKKWILVSYLFLAAMTWVFFYKVVDIVWFYVELPSPSGWFLTPAQAIAFVPAVVLFIIFQRNEKINTFASEVATELSKVTWPEKKETVLSAGVIIVMVAICALILFAFDSLWGTFIKVLY